MFRKEVYEKAGGYRAEFYYAQDWDLWYRLAALGTFAILEQDLYRGRITPGSISALHRNRQVAYAQLSRKANSLRLSGQSDDEVVRQALRFLPRDPHVVRRSDQSRAMHFIGRCLADNDDPRATRYFWNAISSNPFHLRAWYWAAKSLTCINCQDDETASTRCKDAQNHTNSNSRFEQSG
jgi:hypothetical protein